MKLYELERGSKLMLKVVSDNNISAWCKCTLNSIDGMYSNITIDSDPEAGPVHLAATTEMKNVGDYYEIAEDQE